MKKKLLTILLVIFSVSTCLFTLTACRHEHSYTTTYTWNDNLCKAVRVCSKDSSHVDTEIAIGVYVKDADANCVYSEKGHYKAEFVNSIFETQETAKNSVTKGEPVGEHVWEYGNCTVCGETQLKMQLSIDNQYYIVSGIGSFAGGELVIPSTYNNLPVTSIGYGAFEYCSSLTSIEIPNSVTSIGSSAFFNCSSLTKVNYTGTIDSWVQIEFGSTDANPLCYAKSLYTNDVLVTQANITTATKINSYAFEYCSSLTSIVIPNSVTSIGDYAFYNCSSLTSIVIPNSVTSIGNWTFDNCTSLTSVVIGDSVTSIGGGAFEDCSSLTSITVDENNENYCSIDGNLYNKDATTLIQYAIGKTDTSFIIPNSVTSIGSAAFSDCSSLTNVTIGNNVTSIGSSAFEDCSSLTNVTIGNNVTSIGPYAFYYCTKLTNITIPNSVTSIGYSAFSDCSSLTSIEIPDSVTSIGRGAFSYCSNLISVTFKDTSTWYTTSSYDNWTNKTGGTETDVTNPSTNATYYKSYYFRYYWYKL